MSEWALLSGLTAEEREDLLSSGVTRHFARNEVMFHQGDPARSLHLIVSGRVAARLTTAAGETVTVRVMTPGEVVGELALLVPDATRSATGVALEPVETLMIDAPALDRARGMHPSINDALLRSLAYQIRELDARLMEALYLPAQVRIARRLVELVEEYGPEVPLRQEDVAGLAGTTRATVNRTMRRAEARGWVKLRRGRVIVIAVEALRELADLD